MKKSLLFISIFSLFSQIKAQVMWQFNKDSVVTWSYQWGDEFNGSEIDTLQWSYSVFGNRSIYSNKEQQYYTNGKNHILENGVYKIIVKKEGIDAKTDDGLEDNDSLFVNKKFVRFNKSHFNYTSEKLESRKLFAGGFYEIRFKASKDRGLWPAFWLYGGCPDEEIDIFELKGERKNKIHVDTHCDNCDVFTTWYFKKMSWGGWISLSENLTEGFNVVSVEWQENFIKYYLNGKCIAYVPVSFKIPKTLQVNVALPSDNGPFHPGPNVKQEQFDPFEVDYIRVWNKEKPKEENKFISDKKMKSKISVMKEGKSQLKVKNGFLYGKKVNHKNEGPQISLIPTSEGNYIVNCTGLENGKKFEIKLTNNESKEVYSVSSGSFQTELKWSQMPKGSYRLIIKCNGREKSVQIDL